MVSGVRRAATAVALLATLTGPAARAAAQVSVEVFGGTAYSVPTPLRITQSGSPPLRFTAHWSTRPLSGSPYYAWRITWWKVNRGWAVDFVHHKVYLENNPPEVQRFEITHGYNLLALGRRWRDGTLGYSLGAGVVIGHPESTVRGRTEPEEGGLFGNGYRLAGATLLGGVGERLELSKRFYASVEGRLTASYARVPIRDGHASVPNVAVHVLVGLGGTF